jgi:hypothetical protein
MKKISLALILTTLQLAAFACPLCEKKQPAVLRGITHGTGPDSNWDYAIVSAMVVIVLITLVYTIKYLVKPGEKNLSHIKHTVIN